MIVNKDATLTLKPGSMFISFLPEFDGDTLLVNGTLKAGEAGRTALKDTVSFRYGINSTELYRDKWSGIVGTQGSSLNLNNVSISKAKIGIKLHESANLAMNHSSFYKNGEAIVVPAWTAYNSYGEPNIELDESTVYNSGNVHLLSG